MHYFHKILLFAFVAIGSNAHGAVVDDVKALKVITRGEILSEAHLIEFEYLGKESRAWYIVFQGEVYHCEISTADKMANGDTEPMLMYLCYDDKM